MNDAPSGDALMWNVFNQFHYLCDTHRYQKLLARADLVRRLADVLSIEVSDERIGELASAATFERMRGRADELAPGVDHKLWRSNENFFRSGTSGQWRDLLGSAALDRYRSRVAELAPPELAEWLHRP